MCIKRERPIVCLFLTIGFMKGVSKMYVMMISFLMVSVLISFKKIETIKTFTFILEIGLSGPEAANMISCFLVFREKR